MAQIETSTFRIGSNDLILKDAQARQDISNIAPQVEASFATDTATGAIASFPDGADNVPVKSLKVNVEPVQDLHGQANPYPAGGGKNKLPFPYFDTTKTQNGVTFTVNSDGTVTVQGTATANTSFVYSADIITDIGLSVGDVYIVTDGTTYDSSSCYSRILYADTSAGLTRIQNSYTLSVNADMVSRGLNFQIWVPSGVNLTTARTFKPMIRLSSVSDATYAPYSNICPISGHTSAVVTRTGVNVWDEEWELGVYNISTGAPYGNNNAIRSKNRIAVKPSTTYYGKNAYLRVLYYDKDDNYLTYKAVNNATFTTPDQCRYIRFYVTESYGTTYNHDISINYPSTDHDYHAYTGEVYTIDLNDTRYGGTLDVTTGLLTIDRVYMSLTADYWTVFNSSKIAFTNASYLGNLIEMCDSLVAQSGAPSAVGRIGVRTSDGRLGAMPQWAQNLTSLAEFKTALANNPINVVMRLAEPQTVQLTTTLALKTYFGWNNIYSDTGDVEVEYRADTKLYIEKLTAPTEDDLIADHAISANSFFMIGNTLYRATTAIASGATITVGTNATKLSLSDALNALA